MKTIALILSMLALLISGCDSGVESADTPVFANDPAQFLFASLPVGSMDAKRIRLINLGSGELVITDVELNDESTANEFSLHYENKAGEAADLPQRIRIAAGADAGVNSTSPSLIVEYRPSDNDPADDFGQITLKTNDPQRGEVTLNIVTGEQGAEILVSPRAIQFDQVDVGSTAVENLTINNVGRADLLISRFSINGSADRFSAQLNGQSLLEPLREPLVIPTGESVTIEVTYSALSVGPANGELLITSNDIEQQSTTVGLIANGAAPCIQVVPDLIDFGSALMVDDLNAETPNRQALSIESCGTTPLRIDRIEVEGGDGAFRMLDLPEAVDGEPLLTLPAATAGEDFPSQIYEMGFWPTELQAYGGIVQIYSNATLDPFQVDLIGRGVENACPVPISQRTEYNVLPLDVIDLDGSPSTDFGGRVERWEWTVVSRPDGSVSQIVESFNSPRSPADGGIEDDQSTPHALFFVDLAGQYEIELRVYDELGQVSCEPTASAQVAVHAVPEKDLHIQLVWSTPDDPDETDGLGTDVDLHFRHEAGELWSDQKWDCYFGNTSPDWGIADDVTDNPTLDIDDTNGAGPENVNMASPEVDVSYDIGAIYFRSESTFGLADADPRQEHLSYVTVRVFVRGELLVEFIDRELSMLRQLWRIATITWCEDFNQCPTVEIHDEVLEEIDYAP